MSSFLKTPIVWVLGAVGAAALVFVSRKKSKAASSGMPESSKSDPVSGVQVSVACRVAADRLGPLAKTGFDSVVMGVSKSGLPKETLLDMIAKAREFVQNDSASDVSTKQTVISCLDSIESQLRGTTVQSKTPPTIPVTTPQSGQIPILMVLPSQASPSGWPAVRAMPEGSIKIRALDLVSKLHYTRVVSPNGMDVCITACPSSSAFRSVINQIEQTEWGPGFAMALAAKKELISAAAALEAKGM